MAEHQNDFLQPFADSLQQNLTDMANVECECGGSTPQLDTFASLGFSVIIGIVGKRNGRVIIDMRKETASKLTNAINEEEITDLEFIMDTIAELSNIVSGNAITKINNQYRGMQLMLTPPSVFLGDKLQIISPRLKAEVVYARTPVGDIVISLAFEGEK